MRWCASSVAVTRRAWAFSFAATLLPALTLLEPLGTLDRARLPSDTPSAPSAESHAATVRPRTAGSVVPDEAAEAAAAVRAGDCARGRELLAPIAAGGSPEASDLRVILGLYAHACGELETARDTLLELHGYRGRLEDWRLLALGDSLAELGQLPAAQGVLDKLLAEHPGSPLRTRALQRAADLALERGDWYRALEIVEDARASGLPPAEGAAFEALAWEVARALDSAPLRANVARRLLVEHPITASKLEVVEIFRHPSGKLDWPAILSSDELTRRARRLLDLGLIESAGSTLDETPAGDRGLEWSLLKAEALTRDHHGPEALALLAPLRPEGTQQEAEIEWRRARAALDAARVHRGRRSLPADDRRRLDERARAHLWRVAELDVDRQRSLAALELLFSEIADEEDFERSLEVLRTLRRLDPADTTGARHLWKLGWRAYDARNYAGAIGYWTELGGLYPESSFSRAGSYWTGRAHQKLGHAARAREIFERVAAVEVTDFYRRHALAQLGPGPAAEPERTVPEGPWPRDPLLARAELLSDLGLDAAALAELKSLADGAEPRARHALEALILARQGQRRESIIALWRAFPSLGAPDPSGLPDLARRLFLPLDYREIVDRHARSQGIPIHLVFGMIRQESAFDAAATSRAGARGLMQLMPTTGRELARRLGLPFSTGRLTEPDYSVRLGTTYFRQVLGMFDHNEELALAGYNAGPYRIKRLWRDAGQDPELDTFLEGLDLDETRTYVKRVLLFADGYRRLYADLG